MPKYRAMGLGWALVFWASSVTAGVPEGVQAYKKGDYAAALTEFKPAATEGSVVAQSYLGWMYERGQGLPPDSSEAAKWYLLAAQKGDVSSQYRLGVMYDDGQGVTQDYVQAAKWYRKSADQGHPNAQNRLGLMYEIGRGGLPQDYTEALKWFRRAVDQESAVAAAQFNIGVMFRDGLGVLQDYTEAAMWFRKSADQGFPQAQYALGNMYIYTNTPPAPAEISILDYTLSMVSNLLALLGLSHGWNAGFLPQDYIQAYKWYNIAAVSGFKDALKDRNEIIKHMTPAQIAKGQRMAREWAEAHPKH